MTLSAFLAFSRTPRCNGAIFAFYAVARGVQWHNVLAFAQLQRDYPPAILAAVHFRTPPSAMPMAVFMTVMSLVFFVQWYRSIPR